MLDRLFELSGLCYCEISAFDFELKFLCIFAIIDILSKLFYYGLKWGETLYDDASFFEKYKNSIINSYLLNFSELEKVNTCLVL